MLDHPLAVRRAVFRRRVRRGSLRKHSRRGEHGAGQREYQSCLLHGEISPVDAVKILSGREPENTCRALRVGLAAYRLRRPGLNPACTLSSLLPAKKFPEIRDVALHRLQGT